MSHDLVRVCGAFAVASAAMMMTYWYGYVLFMPYAELSTTLAPLVLHPAWQPINAIGAVGALLGLLALPGMYCVQARQLGMGGALAFLGTLGGSALLLGPMLWDTVLWRALATHDAGLLSFDGPIYASPSFLPFFILAGLSWGMGYLAFGVVTVRAGVLPKLPARLLGFGAPLFAVGSLSGPLQATIRSIGITAFAVGLAGIGIAMVRRAAVRPQVPAVPE